MSFGRHGSFDTRSYRMVWLFGRMMNTTKGSKEAVGSPSCEEGVARRSGRGDKRNPGKIIGVACSSKVGQALDLLGWDLGQ